MTEPMTLRETAAAMHGLATNRAYPLADRLQCALQALEWYAANVKEEVSEEINPRHNEGN